MHGMDKQLNTNIELSFALIGNCYLFYKFRLPTNFYWDTDDSRLFACETRLIQTKLLKNALPTSSNKPNNKTPFETTSISGPTESVANVMFVTDKCEIKELESLDMMSGEQLVNLCVPNVVT